MARSMSPRRAASRVRVPSIWIPLGRPEYLIQEAHKSCWRLGVEAIDLWQLHRVDPKVPRRRAVRRDQIADQGRRHPLRRPFGGRRFGNRGRLEVLSSRHGAEPLQPRGPGERSGPRPLREERDWLHPLVSAERRRAGARGLGARRNRPHAERRHPARSPSPGCSSAARSCCPSRAQARSRISRKTSRRRRSG